MGDKEEITICPRCGSNLSDPADIKPFNHRAIISWTGKEMCPNCHYYGFFLSVPKSEYEKLEFPPHKVAKRSYREAAKQAAHENSWIALAVAVALMVALAYMIMVPALS